MPQATVDLTKTKTVQLETAPPDGFVELRMLSYGEYLARRDAAMKMGMDSKQDISIDVLQATTTMMEFRLCIINHNLEDHTGRKLNLGNSTDFSLLDPKVGEEIATAINEMNQWSPKEEDSIFPESEQQ